MKTFLLGYEHVAGTSKNTGEAYDFATLHVAVENEKRSNHVAVGGLTPSKINVDPALFKSLKNCSFPCEAEIVMEQRLTGRGPRAVITDVKPI
ncbi:MAG: hypothetical protein OQL06_09990 [Gammaproteobacteria bacterium]|nr:hypothetical protein [Gammaproteobacteria bacterium]